ncbi:MAG: GGDEF domain-containing protein [Aurantimonas coralicida]
MTRSLQRQPLTKRGFFKLAGITLCGVLSCIAVSLAYNAALFRNVDAEAFGLAMICAVVLPIILAGPLFVYLSLQLRDLRLLNRQLKIVAAHDCLTTLFNRGAFTEQVEAQLQCTGANGRPGALFLIDADFFKSINDRYGHATGDRALKAIALQLQDTVRKGDIIGRLGGEEFGVLLADVDPLLAKEIAERMREAVATMELSSPEGKPVPVSVSIGGVIFDRPVGYSYLYQEADNRLYEAKARGRNRVVVRHTAPAAAEPDRVRA